MSFEEQRRQTYRREIEKAVTLGVTPSHGAHHALNGLGLCIVVGLMADAWERAMTARSSKLSKVACLVRIGIQNYSSGIVSLRRASQDCFTCFRRTSWRDRSSPAAASVTSRRQLNMSSDAALIRQHTSTTVLSNASAAWFTSLRASFSPDSIFFSASAR